MNSPTGDIYVRDMCPFCKRWRTILFEYRPEELGTWLTCQECDDAWFISDSTIRIWTNVLLEDDPSIPTEPVVRVAPDQP